MNAVLERGDQTQATRSPSAAAGVNMCRRKGLNLQFAGTIANFDLPWNPTQAEQRSGRIDRLGQSRPVIRALCFAYKDTVEQDVFFTVGNRNKSFRPILPRLPRQLEELALLDKDARAAERQRFIAELDQNVTEAKERGFDIDVTADGSLDLPSLPEPALTLRDLDGAMQIAGACPPEVGFNPLDFGSHSICLAGRPSIRVTTDAGICAFSSDNY